MSLEANRSDLEQHTRDFTERTGFTYTVLRPGTEEVIGCLYDVAELDGPLRAAVYRWLVGCWPFERVIYADRP
jgi:hypothetical protein